MRVSKNFWSKNDSRTEQNILIIDARRNDALSFHKLISVSCQSALHQSSRERIISYQVVLF